MCGLVGVYEYGRAEGSLSPALLKAMGDTLRHRGPDGEGCSITVDRRIGLAHRRLAIVDPTGGAQPMEGPDGTLLAFNGEIYNYPELRRELTATGVEFRTRCDTEVILHLYARHAERCVEFLKGMFAFVLWDPSRRRLFFARDRVGEKPLYWADVDGTFLCASEIKALLAHPLVRPAVNEDALAPYLANLVVPSPSTLYQGIFKLPAGASGICDQRGVRIAEYWSAFEPRRWSPCAPEDAAASVRELLERSVEARLMSDVPVGVLLSGGLDSTTIVALLRERAEGLATFSVGFADDRGLDERTEARWVADHYGTDHHEIAIAERDALGFLPGLIHHQDEPLADPVCIPLHFVCGLARRHGVKVVLAGEGADEAFWGYPRYRRIMAQWRWLRLGLALPRPARALLPNLVPRGRKHHRRDLLEALAQGRPLPMHFPLGLGSGQRQALLREPRSDHGWCPRPAAGESPLETLCFDTQEYEFGIRLPELLLMRIDRLSMANGVEARVPFLDPELVEFAYRLPVPHKLKGGVGKLVLRHAVADIVPPRVLRRPKQGFGAPISTWFGAGLGEVLARLMTEEAVCRYFRPEGVQTLLDAHRAAKSHHEFALWPVLNFALWHQYWIEGRSLDAVLEPVLETPRSLVRSSG